MRNKQIDLDTHLFAQLERLDDESLEGEALEAEIRRATALSILAAQINKSRSTQLRAAQFMDQALDAHPQLPFEVK